MRHWISVVRAVGAVLATAIISWAVGLAAYRIALLIFFNETPSPGDWRSVVAWSALACTIGLLPVLATTLALRLRLESRWRWVIVPTVVALIGVTTGMLLLGTAWRFRSVLSPEAVLFTLLFASAGASFAIGLELLMRLSERKLRAHED